jgi:hypothetical protein
MEVNVAVGVVDDVRGNVPELPMLLPDMIIV